MILSMSLNGSSECPEGSARGFKGRRMVFDLDLNYPPPEENTALTDPRDAQPRENGYSQRETLVNAEFIDEEIVVVSPRKFAEAMSNSQRNRSQRSCGVIDRFHDPAEACSHVSGACVSFSSLESVHFNWELYLNMEVSNKIKKSNVPMPPILPHSEPQHERPTFSCAICMGQLIEETSTKCGHIFCKKCIEVAIAIQHKCPTCRHKLRKRDIFRVYLPTAS
ncbi:uncharacterized protein LOC133871927 isoform X2 [Alnus glutinosa]|uniref:uncharacterized protein LOC133871927 isoform X2 n=1 Tax=Alnus glutinosa TaxID=3517 RepID=UPI002D7902F6|nr:uncharacterized protein LOC133871927 isoform X2 [Alnus glutinosa]